jgi:hypothetical protein
MVKKGEPVGGNGGDAFDLFRDQPVKQLDVWYGRGSGDGFEEYTVLRGIRVKWADDEEDDVGFCPPGEMQRILHTSFDFERNGNDPLDRMDIYGSTGPSGPSGPTGRANSLRLVTRRERDYFEAGGIGGDKRIQPADGRKLYGFYGRAKNDIDQLGAVFND